MEHFIRNIIKKIVLTWAKKKSHFVTKNENTDYKVQNCILIHGPIDGEIYEYAIKLCRLYFNDAYIVVSTWNYTDKIWIKKVDAYVNKVILNVWPDYEGDQHRNCQIKTINAGLEWIKKVQDREEQDLVGVTIKLRSDCVLTNRDVFSKLRYDLEHYPLKFEGTCDLNGRIFVIMPRKYIPYRANDFLMGGRTEDLQLFWNMKYSVSENENEQKDNVYYNITKKSAPEEFFYLSFAENIGWNPSITLEDGWEFWKELFCVWNMSDFGVIWLKDPTWNLLNVKNWYGKWKRNPDLLYIDHKFWKRLYNGKVKKSKKNYDVKNIYYSKKIR